MSMTPPTRRATADFLNDRVRAMPPSGIRRFFDMLAEMTDVISLTIGEPDFDTPEHITRAAIDSLERGETHYTANGGMIELREMIAANLAERYGVHYDARTELIITVGASEAVDASLRATLNPATRSSITSRASWPMRRASSSPAGPGAGQHDRWRQTSVSPPP